MFRRDLVTGITVLVSVDSTGGPADATSDRPAISADGRYVAFLSGADDLVAGDGNRANDVFVRDLQSGTTTRVSVSPTGGDVHGGSGPPSISGDGRFVAFESGAPDVVSGDLNGGIDVFVRDLVTGTTSRASVDSSGGDANNQSESLSQALSADGRFVAFSSAADDLVSGDTNGITDIFVRDRLTGTTSRVSADTAGGDPNGHSEGEAISGDGRYVSFLSQAGDLIANDTNGTGGNDVFVRDRATGTTTRANEDAFGRRFPSETGMRLVPR